MFRVVLALKLSLTQKTLNFTQNYAKDININFMDKKQNNSIPTTKKEVDELKEKAVKHLEALKRESKLMRSVMDDMKDLYRMLTVKMKQFGITGQELEALIKEPPVKNDLHQHPLVTISSDYAKLSISFLDNFFYEHQKMAQQFSIEISLDDVHDEIETISSYNSLLVSKSWNFLNEYNKKKSSKNSEKFYYLVKQALSESRDALKSFGLKRQDSQKTTKKLIKLLDKAKTEIEKFKI